MFCCKYLPQLEDFTRATKGGKFLDHCYKIEKLMNLYEIICCVIMQEFLLIEL